MDVSASALTGAMKVGLQIVSAYREPRLEVYYEVLSQYGPEQELKAPSFRSDAPPEIYKTRFHETHVQFLLINVGGQRAENVRLKCSGTFQRSAGRDFGGLFDGVIPQIAPGQALQLFLLGTHELEGLGKERGDIDFKDRDLVISAQYDSPDGFVNTVKTGYARMRKKAHHTTEFCFFPRMVWGDLPPARYA